MAAVEVVAAEAFLVVEAVEVAVSHMEQCLLGSTEVVHVRHSNF